MNITEQYYYQPSADDLANFEVIWKQLWHPRFRTLPMAEYMMICNFAFECFLVGVNQHKADVRSDLQRTLDNS